MSNEAIVIGGGVVGLASAVMLARQGHAVVVVERSGAREAASWGNAGHVAIEQVDPLASWPAIRSAPGRLFSRGGALALPPAQWRSWLPFALRMMRAARPTRFEQGQAVLGALLAGAMPAWIALADSLPGEPLLRMDGHFVAWGSDRAAAAGRAAWQAAAIGTARFRSATAGEQDRLRALAPALRDAIRFENSGQVRDLGQLAEALERALADAGGHIRHGEAQLHVLGGAAGVSIDGGPVERPALLLVAAGVRSEALLAPLGWRVPLVAERGYHLRATDHGWPDQLPPVVFEDRSLIVTRYRSAVQVASFVELGDPDAPPDPAKWRRLEAHVAALGLPIRAPFTRWMGCRPTLPDYLPAIGRSVARPNLLYAFGHQHLGLTLAPVTAEIVAALAGGRVPPIDLAPLSITRFNKGRAL